MSTTHPKASGRLLPFRNHVFLREVQIGKDTKEHGPPLFDARGAWGKSRRRTPRHEVRGNEIIDGG